MSAPATGPRGRTFPVPGGGAVPAGADAPAVEPRPASTVMLVRDRPGSDRGGVEVFLMQRRRSMTFASGALVFPGGGVDPRDADPDVPWTGPAPEEWADVLRVTPGEAAAFVCAAVRETFEECGVLLAAEPGAADLCRPTGPGWEEDREALVAHAVALSELLRERGLVLRADLLRPWAHWITPAAEPRRFDTRFFLAALPRGQEARDLGGEAVNARWWRPQEALRLGRAGEAFVMPPTQVCLEELAAAPDTATLWEQKRTLRTVMPTIERNEDGVRIVAEI